MFCIVEMLEYFYSRHIPYEKRFILGSSNIAHARSQAAKYFLDSGLDVLLFVDDDIAGFDPGNALTIVNQAHDRGIVSGVYAKKSKGAGLAMRPRVDNINDYTNLLEVLGAPMGFTAIRRSAVADVFAGAPEVGGGVRMVFDFPI